MDFTQMILLDVEADYEWDSPGIIRIGKKRDILVVVIKQNQHIVL